MKKVSLLLLFLSACYSALAQLKPGPPNELDNKYSPGQSPVFSSSDNSSTQTSSTSSGSIDFKNVAKCNLALLPRSIFALSYERFLSDQVSAEGSLGIAYNKDQIFSLVGAAMDFNSTGHTSKVSLSTMYANGKKRAIGLYTGASIKFHFTGGCYSGYYSNWNWSSDAETYLELGFRYYGNHLTLTDPAGTTNNNNGYNNGAPQYNNLAVDIRQVNYFINYGYRFTTTGKIKTSHELYCGVGLRNAYYDVIGVQTVTTTAVFPAQGYTYEQYYKTGNRENANMPIFIMGYILGFGWN